jgi:hypothetical protein
MTNDFGEKLKSHYSNHIQQAKSRVDSLFLRLWSRDSYHGIFEGLTDDEIEQIREAQEVEKFPQVYVDYLKSMGRKHGGIFTGCSVGFDELLELKKVLYMMQDQHKGPKPKMPANMFVFLGIQDVDFFFFEATPDQDDPPVFYYMDGMDEYHQIAPSLSSWLWEQAFNPTEKVQPIINAFIKKAQGKTD